MRGVRHLGLVAALGLALAACGSDGSEQSTPTSTTSSTTSAAPSTTTAAPTTTAPTTTSTSTTSTTTTSTTTTVAARDPLPDDMSGTELLREAVRRSLDRSSYTTIVQSWVDGDLFISSVSHVGELAAYSEAQWFGTTSVRRWTVGNVHLVDVNDSGWIRSLEPLGRTTVDQLQDNTLLTELAMLEGTEVRRRDGSVVIELICPADVDPGDLQLCDPRAESTVLITVDLATGFIVEQWIEGLSPISPGDWRPTVNQIEIGPLEWTEKELLAQPDDYDRSAYTCLADLLGVDATDEHAMQAAIEFTTTAENQATFGACGLRFYPPGPDLVERDPD